MNIPHFSQNFELESHQHKYTQQVLFVDARDQLQNANDNTKLSFDVVLSGSNNKDSLNLPPYEQVTRVELKAVCLPKIANEIYYILDIPEFSGRLHSTDNSGSHESFAVIYYPNTDSIVSPSKGYDFDTKVHEFTPPLKSLSKFRVSFKKYGGSDITVADIGGTTALRYVNFLLEFTVKQ